ncbi:hypothetical protein [Streptomyces sp. NPDC059761]|uniref:hypothetical protein n=1 Tax=Streptomyces sp. NPDC059761 TaxID=3346937 RepID=UPI0036494E3D
MLVTRQAVAADRLQHLTVQQRGGRVALTFFVSAPDSGSAEAVAERLCRRALAGEPELSGWTLAELQLGFVASHFERLVAGAFRPSPDQEPPNP